MSTYRSLGFAAWLAMLSTAYLGRSVASAEEKVLFAFDDHEIPWRHNLKLTPVEAQKHPGNPVLRRGPAGAPDHSHAVLYGTVLKIDGKFRMWYLGMFDPKTLAKPEPERWRPMCYAESDDGIAWTKPDLGLVEFNGNTHNNICLIEGTPFSLTRVNDFLSVMHDPADPDPSRRYKAAYIAHVPYDEIAGGMSNIGRKERLVCSTICATSPDGVRWQVVGDRPANAGGERFEVTSLYRFGDFYYSTGQLIPPWTWRIDGSDPRATGGNNAGRVMLAYRSPDFATWSKAKATAFARAGQLTNPPLPGQQTHMGAGIWNRGNLLVGLYGMWQDPARPPAKGESFNKGVGIDLGLIVSNDGIHFREPIPDFKIVPRGQPGEWDDIALLQGHAFVNEGERTMIWYSHWDTGGGLKNMEIGLATLRRDGFGFLSPQQADNDAHLVTASFEAGQVSLNVDGVSAESPLTVELVDHLDRPLPGFVAKITTGGVRVPVNWPQPAPLGKRTALRVTFPAGSTARLYAAYVE